MTRHHYRHKSTRHGEDKVIAHVLAVHVQVSGAEVIWSSYREVIIRREFSRTRMTAGPLRRFTVSFLSFSNFELNRQFYVH